MRAVNKERISPGKRYIKAIRCCFMLLTKIFISIDCIFIFLPLSLCYHCIKKLLTALKRTGYKPTDYRSERRLHFLARKQCRITRRLSGDSSRVAMSASKVHFNECDNTRSLLVKAPFVAEAVKKRRLPVRKYHGIPPNVGRPATHHFICSESSLICFCWSRLSSLGHLIEFRSSLPATGFPDDMQGVAVTPAFRFKLVFEILFFEFFVF